MSLNKFAQLAQLNETIFHTKDLANLWGITNRNTLYTTLKRYAQKKLLFRIYKGLYSLKPLDEIDPLFLGIKAIHDYTYISTESALSLNGITQQYNPIITLISPYSKQFTIGPHTYRSRKLTDQFLYHPEGIIQKNNIRQASSERAIADLLYFNPYTYFDADAISKKINWKKIQKIQKKIGYPLTPKRYDFT